MASANKFISSLPEPWSAYSCFAPDTFARETEALTRALQVSISEEDSSNNSNNSAANSPLSTTPTNTFINNNNNNTLLHLLNNNHNHNNNNRVETNRLSTTGSNKKWVAPGPTGKVGKRKSRATKKNNTTTFITADPSNFRQMVQQVTGVRFSEIDQTEPVIKPEPQRAGLSRINATVTGGSLIPQGWLPTLDTSALLLDRALSAGTVQEDGTGFLAQETVQNEQGGFDFEAYQSFPTLESWGGA